MLPLLSFLLFVLWPVAASRKVTIMRRRFLRSILRCPRRWCAERCLNPCSSLTIRTCCCLLAMQRPAEAEAVVRDSLLLVVSHTHPQTRPFQVTRSEKKKRKLDTKPGSPAFCMLSHAFALLRTQLLDGLPVTFASPCLG